MSFSIVYSVRDEKGQTSLTEVKLPGATTFSNVTLFAQQMALLINPLITGAIVRIGVAFTVALPGGLRAAPTANSDVEEGGRFQFRTALGNFTSIRLPTFDESKIFPSTAEVDTTDGAVLAFVNSMLTGIDLVPAGGTGIIQPSDARDEDITALEFAREQFQSSRRA